MATPTPDEQLDAIAEDVATGVKSVTTGDQTTTLESPTERIEAAEKLRKAKASRRGYGGMVRVSRAIPGGSAPE